HWVFRMERFDQAVIRNDLEVAGILMNAQPSLSRLVILDLSTAAHHKYVPDVTGIVNQQPNSAKWPNGSVHKTPEIPLLLEPHPPTVDLVQRRTEVIVQVQRARIEKLGMWLFDFDQHAGPFVGALCQVEEIGGVILR